MPAFARILFVFAAMLIMVRLRVALGIAVIAGGLLLNLWAGMGVAGTISRLGRAVLETELWLLVVITVLILELGRFVTQQRNASEIIAVSRRWGGRHGLLCSLISLPAAIGLIPMPAGALFSAPLVERTGTEINGGPEWKAAVNYWFRHVWEHWWPLCPGVIVAMSVFEMDSWQFISIQFWFTPASLLAGYLWIVRPQLRRAVARCAPEPVGRNRRALFLMLPLGLVLGSLFVTPLVLAWVAPGMNMQMRKWTALLAGMLAAVGVVFFDERRHGRRLFTSLLQRGSLNVLLSLFGVVVFKSLLYQSGLLPVAGAEWSATGIPPVLAVAGLPFLAGMVTGLGIGFVGTSFPLVMGLVLHERSGLTPAASLALAYSFGYMGMMLSPVHLCLVVTRDYFGASFVGVYRWILPCGVFILAFGCLMYTVLSAFGW